MGPEALVALCSSVGEVPLFVPNLPAPKLTDTARFPAPARHSTAQLPDVFQALGNSLFDIAIGRGVGASGIRRRDRKSSGRWSLRV